MSYTKKYDKLSGQKGLTLSDVVDRSLPLQRLQRGLSKDIPVAMNVDQLLMIKIQGQRYEPAAVMETTLCPNDKLYPDGPNEFYLAECLRRIRDNSCQGEIAIALAQTLGVPCFFLVHDGLVIPETKEIVAASKVWVYPLSASGDWSLLLPGYGKKGWLKLLPEEYERFLFWIGDQCVAKYTSVEHA